VRKKTAGGQGEWMFGQRLIISLSSQAELKRPSKTVVVIANEMIDT
jgi:hypothetical protein